MTSVSRRVLVVVPASEIRATISLHSSVSPSPSLLVEPIYRLRSLLPLPGLQTALPAVGGRRVAASDEACGELLRMFLLVVRRRADLSDSANRRRCGLGVRER